MKMQTIFDYCFFGRALRSIPQTFQELKEDNREMEGEHSAVTVLVGIDQKSGAVFSTVGSKGGNDHAANFVLESLKFCGREQIILFGDLNLLLKQLWMQLLANGLMVPLFKPVL